MTLETTNRLLADILQTLKANPYGVAYPSDLPQYSVRTVKMDTANAAPGVEIIVPGNSIIMYSDAVIDKCYLRVDDPVSDAIPLRHANPYYHAKGFERFYIESDARSGKTLTFLIQRGTIPGSGPGEMQKVGVYSQSAWAVRQGVDKIFYASRANQPAGESTYVTYTPPTGKALYIDFFTGSMYATAAANGELNQIAFGYVKDNTANIGYSTIAGNGGWAFAFPNPVKIPAGHVMVGYIYNMSNHNCEIRIVVGGYELDE